MGKPIDTRTIEYAYVTNVLINANARHNYMPTPVPGNPEDYPPVEYSVNIIVSYELKDVEGNLLEVREIAHESEHKETLWTVSEISEYLATNLTTFIAQDKENLSGYVTEQGEV